MEYHSYHTLSAIRSMDRPTDFLDTHTSHRKCLNQTHVGAGHSKSKWRPSPESGWPLCEQGWWRERGPMCATDRWRGRGGPHRQGVNTYISLHERLSDTRSASVGLGVEWYSAVMRALTDAHTGSGTPWGLCVMGRGREAVGQRLTSAVLRWRAAAGAAAGWALAAGLVHAWVGRWMSFKR
jgi:hypothetical protein